jgi:CheY-like chemotaxis protein
MGASPPWILVVDDDPQVLRGIERIAEPMKLRVQCEATAEAAWKVLQSSEPTALLSDYRLPGMDGLTLLERAQALYPRLRCALHTGEAVHRTSLVPEFPVISKPCGAEDLQAVLRSLVLGGKPA